mgnify:CR=1 FL=1
MRAIQVNLAFTMENTDGADFSIHVFLDVVHYCLLVEHFLDVGFVELVVSVAALPFVDSHGATSVVGFDDEFEFKWLVFGDLFV